jgi:predicted helicase
MTTKIIKTLINKSNNYLDLHNHLSKLSNKQKGDLFEEFCTLVFKFHPYYANNTKEVYLLKDVPTNILKELNLPSNDIGIDVIVITKDNKSYAVQVKFRNNRDTKINYNELATFVGTSFGIANKIDQAFYFTNTFLINKQIQRSKVISIYGDFFDTLPENFFTTLKNYFNEQEINKIIITSRPYQQEVINAVKEHFKVENKGYLEMATGTGKSLTSYWIDKEMNNKLTVILVPSLYLLSQFYKSYCYQSSDEKINCKFILVGSDADIEDENICENVGLLLSTNPDQICAGIDNTQKTIIISTYQSSDKLLESLKKFNLTVDLCIFDEAHKTVGNSDKKWNGVLITNDITIKKRLFMTATPKVYNRKGKAENREQIKKEQEQEQEQEQELEVEVESELELEEQESELESSDDDENYQIKCTKIEKETLILSMCNEQVYGKLIYKYSIDNAVKQGHLNDYQLMTIFTDNEHIEQTLTSKKYVKIEEIEIAISTTYLASALMIFEVMSKKECNHLITYHNSIKNSKAFVKILESLKNYYDIKDELVILHLDGGNSIRERNKIINSFKAAKYAIITSCRALNEGIDIPIVDSVCFCDERTSVSDIIQCVGRSLRKCDGKGISKVLVPIILDDSNVKGKNLKM